MLIFFSEFKWDDVKVDKHRENYIGHSVMAPVGRWQKGMSKNLEYKFSFTCNIECNYYTSMH